MDLNKPNWSQDYGYGPLYYLILVSSTTIILVSLIILLRKSVNSPRKLAFIFPFGGCLLFAFSTYGYIMRVPFAYQTDITLITGLFVLFLFESSIRSGLIPVNTKHIDIFTHSPLKIQILNKEKEAVIVSASPAPLSKETIDKVIDSFPAPLMQEDETLLFSSPIPGGYALWSEDVSQIEQLHREIKASTEKLREANAILAEEEKITRTLNEKNAKRELMEQLEQDISENLEKLKYWIENLKSSENPVMEAARVALLLCYIKRRSSLFFKEKETDTSQADELILYIDELCGIVKYAKVQIALINELVGSLPIRQTTLFYDFFYAISDLAIQNTCPYIIVDIGKNQDSITMSLLPSVDLGGIHLDPIFLKRVSLTQGRVVKKQVENTVGISISFPKGGVDND